MCSLVPAVSRALVHSTSYRSLLRLMAESASAPNGAICLLRGMTYNGELSIHSQLREGGPDRNLICTSRRPTIHHTFDIYHCKKTPRSSSHVL